MIKILVYYLQYLVILGSLSELRIKSHTPSHW